MAADQMAVDADADHSYEQKVSYELVPLLTNVELHFAPSLFHCVGLVVVL